jgi:hypothetical protein
MKFSGWVMSAGLVFAATAANAQMSAPYDAGRSPYAAVSDVDGPYVGGPYTGRPYAVAPPEMPGPRYGGPMLLPPEEVYTVVREAGFSPLGIPRQRGFVYTIAVVDRGGNDGRLVIDARNGRILRFTPAYRMGDNFSEDRMPSNGPAGPLPPGSAVRGALPPPPTSRVASHTPPAVPMPKASPLHTGAAPQPAAPLAAAPSPAPAQQSAAIQTKPAEAPAPVAGPTIVAAKPAAPAIQPTQEMPKAQGLD